MAFPFDKFVGIVFNDKIKFMPLTPDACKRAPSASQPVLASLRALAYKLRDVFGELAIASQPLTGSLIITNKKLCLSKLGALDADALRRRRPSEDASNATLSAICSRFGIYIRSTRPGLPSLYAMRASECGSGWARTDT